MSAAAIARPGATAFEFTNHWHLAAPVERVWDALKRSEDWPQWWPYVRLVREISPGDADGLGARRHIAWSSRLPYGVSFDVEVVEMQHLRRIRGRASGQLEGTGTWDLSPEGASTRVQYVWCVDVSTRWMRVVAPVAAPVFRWNHDGVMCAGARGLARHLGARLIDAR